MIAVSGENQFFFYTEQQKRRSKYLMYVCENWEKPACFVKEIVQGEAT